MAYNSISLSSNVTIYRQNDDPPAREPRGERRRTERLPQLERSRGGGRGLI